MNNGRERGTSRPGVSNGQYNPAVLQNDQPGEIRLFFAGMQPDTKNAVSLANPRIVVDKSNPKAAAAIFAAQQWNILTSNFGISAISSVAYGNGVWVAGGNAGNLRTSTNDGVTWNTQTSNFGTSAICSVAYGNGVWVAGGAGAALRTSTNDGVTWNTQTSNFGTSTILSVAYCNGVWVAGGGLGMLRTLSDALSYYPVNLMSSYNVAGYINQ